MCCFRASCGSEFLISYKSHFVQASRHHPVPVLQHLQWNEMGFFTLFKNHLAKQLPTGAGLNFLSSLLLLSTSIPFVNTEGKDFNKPNNINFQAILIWLEYVTMTVLIKLVCFYIAALKDPMQRCPFHLWKCSCSLTLKKEELCFNDSWL